MGCDIHFFVEIYNHDKQKWEVAPDQLVDCGECNGTQINEDESYCRNCKGGIEAHQDKTRRCLFGTTKLHRVNKKCRYCELLQGKELSAVYYRGRNYALFGILSGVRSNSDPEFTVEDCGLPDDVTPEVYSYLSSEDIHSNTYYVLTDLLNYDWDNATKKLDPELYEDEDWFQPFKKALLKMKRLAENTDDIRCVFGYDN